MFCFVDVKYSQLLLLMQTQPRHCLSSYWISECSRRLHTAMQTSQTQWWALKNSQQTRLLILCGQKRGKQNIKPWEGRWPWRIRFNLTIFRVNHFLPSLINVCHKSAGRPLFLFRAWEMHPLLRILLSTKNNQEFWEWIWSWYLTFDPRKGGRPD